MNKLKILICSVSFYPRISPRSYRATELAKEFSRQGHSVTVYTLINDDIKNKIESFGQKNNIKIKDFVNNKYEIERIKSKNKIWQIFNKIISYLLLWPDIKLTKLLYYELIKEKEEFDLLISIAVPYPVHWGVGLAKLNNKQITKFWVADCGDPFMGNKESKFQNPFYFHFVERWFCKQPDFITVPIESAIYAYPKICNPKIRIIPQGFEFPQNKLININKNNYPLFAYAGAFSDIRNPKPLLDYLSKLKSHFQFVCYTRRPEWLLKYKSILGNKLIIKEYIEREILIEELQQYDFLINFENRDRFQSPSKLIDYAISGKPILSINSAKIDYEKVSEFLQGNYEKRYIVKDIEEYNISNVANKFIALLNNDNKK